MADHTPAFGPLLTKEQADAHLSPIACTNRDVMRRTALRVLTMTPEELTAQAKAGPEEHAARCQIVADLHDYVTGEASTVRRRSSDRTGLPRWRRSRPSSPKRNRRTGTPRTTVTGRN